MPKVYLNEISEYIPYKLVKNKRAKRMILRVKDDGTVQLTVPAGVLKLQYEDFIKKNSFWIKSNLSNITRIVNNDHKSFLENKIPALRVIKEKIKKYNEHYKFNFNRVSVKNQSSRWGSCSTNNNLNFNYKLIFLPDDLQDYIVVHELCHLKEMNHSRSFWALVEETIPHHKQLRRRLRDHEKNLF